MARSKVSTQWRLAKKCCGKFLTTDGKKVWCIVCGKSCSYRVLKDKSLPNFKNMPKQRKARW